MNEGNNYLITPQARGGGGSALSPSTISFPSPFLLPWKEQGPTYTPGPRDRYEEQWGEKGEREEGIPCPEGIKSPLLLKYLAPVSLLKLPWQLPLNRMTLF